MCEGLHEEWDRLYLEVDDELQSSLGEDEDMLSKPRSYYTDTPRMSWDWTLYPLPFSFLSCLPELHLNSDQIEENEKARRKVVRRMRVWNDETVFLQFPPFGLLRPPPPSHMQSWLHSSWHLVCCHFVCQPERLDLVRSLIEWGITFCSLASVADLV